jgi:hypothetical protein
MPYKYERRSQEDWEKRQSSGFEGFIKDDFQTYRPKKGDNQIRIYPPTWEKPTHYGLDVWVHYGVGPDRASVLCLQKMRNEPCPLCEARMRAQRAGEEDDAKALAPRQRVVVWMEDKKENKGPVIWGMPKSLDTEISKRCKDRETGKIRDIDDPDNGYDVFFDTEGDRDRTKYTAVEITNKPNRLSDRNLNYAIDHPLPSTLRWRDYEQVLALYEGAAPRRRDDDRGSRRSRDEDEDYRPRRDRDPDEDRPRRSRDADEDDRPRRTRDEDDRPRGREQDETRRSARSDDVDPPFDRDDRRETRSERPSNGADEERPRSSRPTLERRSESRDADERPSRSNGRDTEESERPSRSDQVRGGDRARELQARFAKPQQE